MKPIDLRKMQGRCKMRSDLLDKDGDRTQIDTILTSEVMLMNFDRSINRKARKRIIYRLRRVLRRKQTKFRRNLRKMEV